MAANLLRRTLVALHDLDVRVALEAPDLEALVRVARDLDLRPRIPEPLEALLDPERRQVWVDEKHAVVYTLIAPRGAFSLDVFRGAR